MTRKKEEAMERNHTVSRRQFIRRLAAVGSATALAPLLGIHQRPARAAGGQLVVRSTPGGTWGKANQESLFTPFGKEAGIEVVVTPATMAQISASVEQRSVEVDVIDFGQAGLMKLAAQGALEKLEYGRMKRFNLSSVPDHLRTEQMIGRCYWAMVLAYRTDVFPTGTRPRGWKDFWDVQKFPGPRAMSDGTSSEPDLDFALVADGVPAKREALYPIDVERALKSMTRIRPHILKFFTAATLSAELLERKEVVAESIANGRAQDLVDKGAPVAIEWNEAARVTQCWAIPKGAPHKDLAMQFIDFAMQPKIQADLTKYIAYGPTNRQAFQYVAADVAKKLPSNPAWADKGFDRDGKWWSENLNVVTPYGNVAAVSDVYRGISGRGRL
jgi:putative spermidine/putrescine transport system substrate-binding protein